MPNPKADPPKCDTPGCGHIASIGTDGTEVDHLKRKAIPHINVCEPHKNWPHSDDAKMFALSETYKKRIL